MTDFSKVPWNNIHVIDYGRRYLIDEVEVFSKPKFVSGDFNEHIVITYSCYDDNGCLGFAEEEFSFDGFNCDGDDIHLEFVEGKEIPINEDPLWGSKCFVERIDGTGEPIKLYSIRYCYGFDDDEEVTESFFCLFSIDGETVGGSFSLDGLPLRDDVKEYRLIYIKDNG